MKPNQRAKLPWMAAAKQAGKQKRAAALVAQQADIAARQSQAAETERRTSLELQRAEAERRAAEQARMAEEAKAAAAAEEKRRLWTVEGLKERLRMHTFFEGRYSFVSEQTSWFGKPKGSFDVRVAGNSGVVYSFLARKDGTVFNTGKGIRKDLSRQSSEESDRIITHIKEAIWGKK